jgi:hypothetical protein
MKKNLQELVIYKRLYRDARVTEQNYTKENMAGV